jgi:hypothetical protein
LKDDLEERHDLSLQFPEKVRELNFMLSDWLINTGAKLPRTNPNWEQATLKDSY